MYKILVFSDTHGMCGSCEHIIEKNKDANLIIHCGDCVADAEDLSYIYSSIHFEYVRGNNDYFSRERDEKLILAGDRKIFITHGHTYNVKRDCYGIAKRAKDMGADIAVFGHNHTPYNDTVLGIPLINPGSSGFRGEYGEILIDGDNIKINLLKL